MKQFIALMLLVLLAACNGKPQTVKSPCVGISGSPCERLPINEGMA